MGLLDMFDAKPAPKVQEFRQKDNSEGSKEVHHRHCLARALLCNPQYFQLLDFKVLSYLKQSSLCDRVFPGELRVHN